MDKIKARYKMADLIHWSLEQLRSHAQVPIIVECDDGEVETIIEEIILSWFLWELHRKWPKTPCMTYHHFAGVTITPHSHLDILGKIQKDCFYANRVNEYDSLLPYNAVVFLAYNNLYNFMAGELTSYMTSISILDYLEVLDHPDVKAVNDRIQSLDGVSDRDIKEAYDDITAVLDKDGVLEDNALRRAFKHRLVSIAQILQDIGPRGFVTDVDSHIFPKPIRTGYAQGLRELPDYLAESRTATVAEIMTGSPMQASEYLNRLLQLSVSRVKDLARMDCGTTELAPWFVDTYSKLKDLEGMYFLNEQTGQQEPIESKKHKHLVGQNIQLRTVFNCKHPKRDTICAKCFGELTHNVHDNDNIGHISTIEFQSGQTQIILSYKHLTGSSSVFGIYIDEIADKYFKITNDTRFIKFIAKTNLKGVRLVVPRDAIRGFEYLLRIDSWSQVSPGRVSWVQDIVLMPNPDTDEVIPMTVADENNKVHFTLDALKFLSKTEYVIKPNGDYVFDITNWDINKFMFGIPKVQFDVLEYTKMLETFIKGPESGERIKTQQTIMDFDNPIGALATFHDLVAERLSIPVSHLQVVLLSTTCDSPAEGDYRLPKDRMRGVFTSNNTIMRNNSASVALGFQNQEKDIYKPESYIGHPRPNHPIDVLLFGEVSNNSKNR